MRDEIYNEMLITWYPGAERAEIHLGGKHPSKEDYKRNLVSYGSGAIYVMDPLGILHTDTGGIILTEGEVVKYKMEKIKKFIILRCSVKELEKKRLGLFPSGIFENFLPGIIYKTTKRLVFIQECPGLTHSYSRSIFTIPEAVRDWRLWKAGRWVVASVPLKLIADYDEFSRKTVKLYLPVDTAGYVVIIRPCDSQLLEGLAKWK